MHGSSDRACLTRDFLQPRSHLLYAVDRLQRHTSVHRIEPPLVLNPCRLLMTMSRLDRLPQMAHFSNISFRADKLLAVMSAMSAECDSSIMQTVINHTKYTYNSDSAISMVSSRKSASCSVMHIGGLILKTFPNRPPLPIKTPMSFMRSKACRVSSLAGAYTETDC